MQFVDILRKEKLGLRVIGPWAYVSTLCRSEAQILGSLPAKRISLRCAIRHRLNERALYFNLSILYPEG